MTARLIQTEGPRGRPWGRVLVATVLTLLAGAAHADLLVSYDFPDSGVLDGLDGGEGWFGPWTANTMLTELLPPPDNFSYEVPGGGMVDATGAVQLTGDSDTIATRSLEGLEAEDVYISYLFQWTGGPVGENDFAVWWFEASRDAPNIGLKSNIGPGGVEDFMVRFLLDSEAWVTDEVEPGETYFIVGHLFKSGGQFYDTFDMWVNPSFGDQDAPEASAFGGGARDLLTILGIRTVNLAPGDQVMFGTLRIGTDWEDVVPAGTGGETTFVRGDVNVDGTVNIADTIALLGALFSGQGDPPCISSADANDDGGVNIADAIAVLGHLFGGAGPLPAPTGTCGPDPTPDTLGCASFTACR